MSSIHDSDLKRWLDAERKDRPGSEREAEEALLALFEALPLLSPPAGFADRVLERAGLVARVVPVPARSDLFASFWSRVTLAACLAGVALGVISIPSVLETLYRLGSLVTFGAAVQSSIQIATQVLVALIGVLRMGSWVFTVGRALTLPLVTPQVTGALLGCLLLSAASFYVLRDLIFRERSWNYVDS